MTIMLSAGDAGSTPDPSSGGSNSVAIIIALIALVPALIGLLLTVKQRSDKKREQQENNASAFGTKLAETAFRNMEVQVARLTEEQERWEQDRERWNADKRELLAKISDMTDQLHLTNQYLQLLLSTLDAHSIPRPRPPSGWDSNS